MEIGVKALQAGSIEAVYCTQGKPAAAGDLLLALRPTAGGVLMDLGITQLLEAYRAGTTDPRDVVEELIARKHEADPFNVWISRVDDAALRSRADGTGAAAAGIRCRCTAFRSPSRTTSTLRPCRPLRVARRSATHRTSRHMSCNDWWMPAPLSLARPTWTSSRPAWWARDPPMAFATTALIPRTSVAAPPAARHWQWRWGRQASRWEQTPPGSGRVPAAFNNLVGYKPTLGRLSTRGMVPACLSLDAMSIFAVTRTRCGTGRGNRRGPGPAGSLVAGACTGARSRLVAACAVPLCGAAACAARIPGQRRIRAAV